MAEEETINEERLLSSSELPDCQVDLQSNLIAGEGTSSSGPVVVVVDESTQSGDKLSKKKKKEEPPSWFEVDDDHNTNVYISNLPLDTTEEEFITLMKKYGLLMKDLDTGQFKIKMYKDKEGNFKGDALCCYIKVESVDLALQLLDGSMFKDNEVSCERAKFQLKGDYDPRRRPRKRKGKEKKKIKEKIERLFDWRPDKLPGQRSNSEKTVIIKNVFDVSEFDKEPELILEYKTDIREECEAKCGPVKRVDIYDRNPEGVVQVIFQDFDSADKCVQLMNGRWFAQRKLEAFLWDGRTKYKTIETEEDAAKRIDGWNQFLENEDDQPQAESSKIQSYQDEPIEEEENDDDDDDDDDNHVDEEKEKQISSKNESSQSIP